MSYIMKLETNKFNNMGGELFSEDYIEKYLNYVHCEYMQVYNSHERLHHWEPATFSQCSSMTNATICDYEDVHYIVRKEYTPTELQSAIQYDILPAIRMGNAEAMFVYSIILVGDVHCATTFIKNKEALKHLMLSIRYGCIAATAYWGKMLWSASKYDETWIFQQLNVYGDYGTIAKKFLEQSASQGHVDSYFWLSQIYLEIPNKDGGNPTGHTIKDMTHKSRIEEGLKLCQIAVEKGCFNAIVRLANWLAGSEKEIWRGLLLIKRPSNCPYDDNKASLLYRSAITMCETYKELSGVVRNAPNRLKYQILKQGYEKGLCDPIKECKTYYKLAYHQAEPDKTELYQLAIKLYSLTAGSNDDFGRQMEKLSGLYIVE